MVADVGTGWRLDVDESPDWLFFRLIRSGDEYVPEPPLAEALWRIVEQRGPRRVVFEMVDGLMLTSFLVGQLVLLHKRAELVRGTFRLCGIAAHSYETLHMMGLAGRFPNYRSREDAVMGRAP
ncbi:MAG: STAS domain-containing protein [Planctomycetaceae bacterium]